MATRSITLTKPECLLLQIAQDEMAQEINAAKLKAAKRIGAIYEAHGLPAAQEGYFQVDPLRPGEYRFLYDDGTVPDVPDPTTVGV